ncbi:uncharacterized protein LOC135935957 isoform X1 [Cloeon dipterum]|uniref:uncharacterized protein LOC135935957 isoform X1 n=1 Tax=Cloeon dipterum TaxID=197152 RepID=UPI00321F8CA1
MTRDNRTLSLAYLVLVASSGLILPVLAVPPPPSARQARLSPVYQHSYVDAAYPSAQQERKYDKPTKKIAKDSDNEISLNTIQENGFSWGTMLSSIMQLLFTPALNAGPTKSDSIDTDSGVSNSPWANILAVGLKILSAILGGGAAAGDGIDKVDNASPLQGVLTAVLSAVMGAKDPEQVSTMAKQAGEFINIVVNLLDALKTSFSQRSANARSIGQKDIMSEAGIAGITLMKAYVKTINTSNDECKKLYICEGSKSCQSDLQGGATSLCLFSAYTTSMLLEKTSSLPFTQYYEASRRGRSGVNCSTAYETCNDV